MFNNKVSSTNILSRSIKYLKRVFSKHYIISLIFALSIISIILFDLKGGTIQTSTGMPLSGKTVIIDAGHGGIDPGVGKTNGKVESELNLMITTKLQNYLEASGCYVLLTRNNNEGLYNPNSKSKKKDDMANRKMFLQDSNATIAISIHQNSFPDSKYKGAQVFYPKDHSMSQNLASFIQSQLRSNLDENNKREIKTEKYYILEKPTIPIVICECGFLTNPEDEKNLNDELYQEKVAWAIYCGINDFFASCENNN